ncbi:hypothetical protein JK151_22660 (plasmid) [Ralstonia syzygii subsp. celebesensis]|uniref:hypothetical protein n=1 Tax=Ralstonia syzygii TaxID=28097 RepID=UPI00191DECF1|nr:hypothetical protein [Ralstonia syzygii]QQV58155.1 hypothetical protein JK151_22660 [Ralstonia syzygii subsp. celebesensis]
MRDAERAIEGTGEANTIRTAIRCIARNARQAASMPAIVLLFASLPHWETRSRPTPGSTSRTGQGKVTHKSDPSPPSKHKDVAMPRHCGSEICCIAILRLTSGYSLGFVKKEPP